MNENESGGKPAALLVIEDDEMVRSGLCTGLASHGFVPTAAASGEEGLAEIERNPPDIVLLDVFMDEMDGIQVLKRIRDRRPRLPVVLLTGYGSMTTAIEALRLGANDYLLKPAEVRDVAHRLRVVLEVAAARVGAEQVGKGDEPSRSE